MIIDWLIGNSIIFMIDDDDDGQQCMIIYDNWCQLMMIIDDICIDGHI